jgi:hypothetical protein
MTERGFELRFDAMRNAIYNSSRRAFFETLTRFLNFIVVASGALAFSDLITQWWPLVDARVLAAIAALAGLLQLVFDFGGRARTHEFLQRRFYEVLAEMAETRNPDEAKLDAWEATLNRLYSEEPPPFRALDAVAYNAAVDATDMHKEGRIPLKLRHILLKQFWRFSGSAF